ncbi:MGDG synthase family glycosyltransferase [Thermaerobacillus caldiproteolyticus]|uniref:MGDG synthase family glycosyltransferase n=1 Tax=Thermaerobacillus caldiproteolyticus TaxID=247480 RepID=UPI00188B5554|nr:UDP-N-acetylglucosamine--LPS N-acetylglucosamine transferase [Anoxybacillus caldiproteolyticus]QPA31172.1 UDP-N-acetylglucosamine--LPS N-acetylglucosamine transferase [Anoxybacillus caldiproteolyticus]
MMRILVLPLFQMSSGHHKVADTLIDFLQKQFPTVLCKKVDFLSYCNEYIEKVISEMYLRWIRSHPKLYHHVYKTLMYPDFGRLEFVHLEPWLPYFEHKMKKMVEKEQPQLIICTHSFPSRILQRLKKRKVVKAPVINVYTDFFMNGIWGKRGIDYHFVPHADAKRELITKYHIKEEQIIVTGIPVHEKLMSKKVENRGKRRPFHLLLAGGNQGLGNMIDFFEKMEGSRAFQYSVLCGTNKKLYEEISSWRQPHIRPLPYISDIEEMNCLYHEVDAVITKPGGVTVSEVLHKRLPLFTIGYLPGQEQINLRYLEEKGLIYNLSGLDDYEQRILHVLNDEVEQNRFYKRIAEYFSQIEKTAQDALKEIVMVYERENHVLLK